MKIEKCDIEGLLIIELDIFKDERGFFVEKFNEAKFIDLGIQHKFVQDNHSRSLPNVIRGLHMQINPSQGKLVSVAKGKILDIAVDARPSSKTFGQYFTIELSDINGKMLWIPAGFLHGFSVISESETDVLYKVNGLYNPAGEIGVKWNDPELNINWLVSNPIVSSKDNNLGSFKEYKEKYGI
ncbi:MAG: dTDP-4-dehydrorhamnose 3,5-epimerase [Alphaproteobacteria bacterium]